MSWVILLSRFSRGRCTVFVTTIDSICAARSSSMAGPHSTHWRCACVDGPHAGLLERLDSGDQRSAGWKSRNQ